MNPLIGVASFLCLTLNMIFWSSLLFLVGLVRLIIPSKGWKKLWTSVTIFVGETCISFNNAWIKILLRPSISIAGMENLEKQHWYIATSNHQSWGDIFILQKITNRKVPLLRFFMKDVLKWIPIVSIVGWALDMPFLKRYSKEQIEKNPSLKGKDVEQAKGPCDMIIKKLGLEPAIKLLSSILELLLAQVKSYAAFVAVKEFIDKIVAQLEGTAKKVAPFMFYYRV